MKVLRVFGLMVGYHQKLVDAKYDTAHADS